MENESMIKSPEQTPIDEIPEVGSEELLEGEATDEATEDGETFEAGKGDGGIDELIGEFPELGTRPAEELYDTERYAELIALGLSAREAYLATAKVRTVKSDNRSHLSSAVPRGAKSPIGKMSASELRAARELFAGASDQEIIRLYKRVTN